MVTMTTPLHRDDLSVPGPGPYALTHSVGCLPRTALARLQEGFIAPWQHKGGDAWGDWLGELDGYRAALAALLGGEAAQYCPQSNLSSGLAKLLGALPRPDARRRVWLAAEDAFPSLGFVLRQGARLGFELRLIPRSQDPAEPATWAAAIGADTFAVLATHVHSNTGVVTPVAQIARLCAQRGSVCVVDVAQSAGILPLSVAALGAPVVLGSCIKWLCGGPGAGFVWIDPALGRSLDPLDVGWFSHADPFEFDIHSWVPASDARRLWGGTPSVAPFVIAAESLRRLADTGIDTVLAHNRRLVRRFIDELPADWRGRVRSEGIGGTLCIPLGDVFDRVTRSLAASGARFDCRGPVVRLSFHLCNDADDAARLARAWHDR
jgi:selenocysteine lyase/cysteine desulfurase